MTLLGTKMVCDGKTARQIFDEVMANPARRKFGFGSKLAVVNVEAFGWRSVFIFGGAVTLAVIPLVLLFLPESLDFLITRRPVNALARINRLAARLGQPALGELPLIPSTPNAGKGRLAQLLAPESRRTTLLIWLLFFLVMFGFYFVMSWTPKLLVAAGLSAQQGISGGVLLSVGGIFGAALIGALASRWRLRIDWGLDEDAREPPDTTELLQTAFAQLREHHYSLWTIDTGEATLAGWITRERDEEAMHLVAGALGMPARPGLG